MNEGFFSKLLGRGTIGTKTSAQKRADSIFSVWAHRHKFCSKKQATNPTNNHALDFQRRLLIGERKTNDQFHAWYDLMIAEYTKPASTKVHDGSFPKKVTTHVIGLAPNGNPVIRTNDKFTGMSHALSAFLSVECDQHNHIDDGYVCGARIRGALKTILVLKRGGP